MEAIQLAKQVKELRDSQKKYFVYRKNGNVNTLEQLDICKKLEKELDKALQACDEEVRAYLFEGKHAEEPQISMDLDTEEMPKKAKGRRKKDALAELTEMVQDGTLTISTNKSATDVSADKEEF